MAGVILTGDKQLEQAYESLEKKVQNKATRKAVRAGAKVLLEATKANVPIGPGNKHHEGGLFRKSLVVRAMKGRRGRIGVSVRIKNVEKIITITQGLRGKKVKGVRHFYPAVIEYGDEHRQPLAPMRRAFDSKKGAALSAMRQIMETEVYAAAKQR